MLYPPAAGVEVIAGSDKILAGQMDETAVVAISGPFLVVFKDTLNKSPVREMGFSGAMGACVKRWEVGLCSDHP